MWCGKQILKIKNSEIATLKNEIELLKIDLKWAKEEAKQWKELEANLARSAPVVIDWDSIEVFSVERMHIRDRQPCVPYTVIGYWKNVNENGIMIRKVGEWQYQIDDANHRILAEQFKNHLDKKAKKK